MFDSRFSPELEPLDPCFETCPLAPGVKADELSCCAHDRPARREYDTDILIPEVSGLLIDCSPTYTSACPSAVDLCPSPETTLFWHDPMVENEIRLLQPASRNVEYQRLVDSGTHNGTLAMLHPLDVYEHAGRLSIVETCPQSPGVKDDELSCYAPGWPAGRESYANKSVEESRDVSDILIPVVSDLFTGCSSTFTSEFDLCPSPDTTHVWHDPMVENEISLMQPATWNFEYQRRTETGSHSMPLAVLHPHDVYDPAGWLSIVDCPHSPP